MAWSFRDRAQAFQGIYFPGPFDCDTRLIFDLFNRQKQSADAAEGDVEASALQDISVIL